MPSVRLTEHLRNKIVAEGRNLFQKSSERADASLADDFYDRVMAEVIQQTQGPYKTLTDQMPPDWHSTFTGVDLNAQNSTGDTVRIRGSTTQRYKLLHLHGKSTYKGLVNGVAEYEYEPGEVQLSDDLVSEYISWKKNTEDVENEEREFISSLKRVLKRCNTLEQFLDSWPQGESLVTPELVSQVTQPRKRRKPREVITPEESTQLSSTLIRKTIVNQ